MEGDYFPNYLTLNADSSIALNMFSVRISITSQAR